MDLVQACRRLAAAGLVPATSGNVSVRDGDMIRLTGTGVALPDMTAEQVATVRLDGTVVTGHPTSELGLHLAIYRASDAGAVVHTHPPKATALACVVDELPVVHYQLLTLGGSIRVAPFHPFGTTELATAAVTALAGRRAALLANHGAVNHAATLAEAVQGAELLEWVCGLYCDAAGLGRPKVLSEDQQVAVRASALRHGYRSLT